MVKMYAMSQGILIDCRDCGFRRETTHADDEQPADVIIDHGRDTGHKLSVDEQD